MKKKSKSNKKIICKILFRLLLYAKKVLLTSICSTVIYLNIPFFLIKCFVWDFCFRNFRFDSNSLCKQIAGMFVISLMDRLPSGLMGS